MFESRPDREYEIFLLGRSNVGKSTLMAELTGHAVETGQRPGVTQAPNHFDWTHPSMVLTDLPGFGFMAGVSEADRERIKTDVIQYVERYADHGLVAVLVVDGKAVIDIIDRHTGPDEVAHVVELFAFLQDVGIPTVVAVNKMDKVDDRDERLNELCDRLGLPGPWQQWQDTIAPITAKRGSIDALESAVREHLHEAGRDDVIGLLF
ncbi:GTP-binding protein EngB [Halococcoides cellulosivorans]|uniref:GTP-binding protein n=1 Tax=Halococcoides cellulosivorans TaxID=1679096 RepID=A0A2R4WYD5_9EURY|nr:GTP-binding protein EngB [Halococcoides cellulosivorans]AWB26543.1 GTP-binding protein [Halococcoides cellulosivorans]